jgi:hypothetical protein
MMTKVMTPVLVNIVEMTGSVVEEVLGDSMADHRVVVVT